MALAAWKHDNVDGVEVIANKTLTAADSGIPQVVTVDGVVISIPATVAGLTFIIRNGSDKPGTVGISVSPVAGDQFNGNGFTAADNKDAINTKATAEPGDELVVVGDGGLGYTIAKRKGIWAREG